MFKKKKKFENLDQFSWR